MQFTLPATSPLIKRKYPWRQVHAAKLATKVGSVQAKYNMSKPLWVDPWSEQQQTWEERGQAQAEEEIKRTSQMMKRDRDEDEDETEDAQELVETEEYSGYFEWRDMNPSGEMTFDYPYDSD